MGFGKSLGKFVKSPKRMAAAAVTMGGSEIWRGGLRDLLLGKKEATCLSLVLLRVSAKGTPCIGKAVVLPLEPLQLWRHHVDVFLVNERAHIVQSEVSRLPNLLLKSRLPKPAP